MRAAKHLAARGLGYSLVAWLPLVALYALFDAADHGIGAALPTIARLVAIAGQTAPVAACIGAVAAAAVAASRGELRALAALAVRPARAGAWAGAGAAAVALLGFAVRAELGPWLARELGDGRPDPGSVQWSPSGDPRWVRSGDALVRCATDTLESPLEPPTGTSASDGYRCTRVLRATRGGLALSHVRPTDRRALDARSPVPAMRLATTDLGASAEARRAAGLSATLLEVELWVRVALGLLALLLPCALATWVAARPSRARTAALLAIGIVALVGLALAATAQGAAAGAWAASAVSIPALLVPAAVAGGAWASDRRI